MKNLKETEKNFLTCAVVIALVGVALIFQDYRTVGILSLIAAGVFVVVFFKMVLERLHDEKAEGKKNEQKNGDKE